MSFAQRVSDLAARISQEIVLRGLPEGGTTGQALQKASNTDFDAEWATPPLAPATVLRVVYDNGWPSRPTSRTDIYIDWVGGTTEPPGMLAGDTWAPELV